MRQIRMKQSRSNYSLFFSMAVLLWGVAISLSYHLSYAAGSQQRSFSSAQEAVKAYVEAVRRGDTAELLMILGPEARDLISSGDEVADKNSQKEFIEAYDELNRLDEEAPGKMVLYVGIDDWSMPIPIVKKGDVWFFDAKEGREEILNRRIGQNELSTIEFCLSYVDAQREYYGKDWDGKGIVEYAQNFESDEGRRNGLYWKADEDEVQSPLGPLAAKAIKEGYGKAKENRPSPYHGYFFKILKGQGKNAPGREYSYVINGHMVAGFGLVAYPAEYGVSGIMTFLLNQNGLVYQKDLGRNTDKVVKSMTRYNPDKTWKKVE